MTSSQCLRPRYAGAGAHPLTETHLLTTRTGTSQETT